MRIVYHITRKTDWAAALTAGLYTVDSLGAEGFIHCSTAQQVIATANRIFRGRRGLVLLCVDTHKVKPEIRYENLEGGQELFPHIYGEINTDAVVQVADFEPGADGYFVLPAMPLA